MEVALARLWQSWGVLPSAVAGHSIGELAAAHVAGVFDLEDACRLVAARSRLLTQFVEGRMVAVFAPQTRVEALIAACETDGLHIALLNAPTQVVVSGTETAIATLAARAEREGVDHRVLAIPGAGHSPLIDPVLTPFRAVARSITYRPPTIPVMSNALGRAAQPHEITSPEYWVDHVRSAVRFTECIDALVAEGCNAFLEVGPRRSLARIVEQCVGDEPKTLVLSSLSKQHTDWSDIADSLMRWHCNGGSVSWEAVLPPTTGPTPTLPTYAFQRRRHWIDAAVKRSVVETGDLRFDAGSLRRVLHAGSEQAQVVPTDLQLDALARVQDLWTTAAHSHLLMLCPPAEAFDAADVVRRNGILEGFHHLVPRWLRILAEAGAIEACPGGHRVVQRAAVDPAALYDEADALAPQHGGWTEFLRRCGQTWAAVLRGEHSGLENLFPNGSLALAERLYHSGPVARTMNGIIRSIVSAAQSQPSSSGPLRILEVGAGTAGTTRAVAPILVPGTTYRFTDLSDFFFRAARRRLADADATFEFGVFDLEGSLGEQGVTPQSFDLIVASNVLHATADLRKTLRTLRGALRPGGLLIAWEVTEHPPWFEFSTTQIEGWNLAEDDLRSEVPLLDVDTWHGVLADAGFEQVSALPEAGAPTSALGQHIFVARAPAGAVDRSDAPVTDRGAAEPGSPAEVLEDFDRAQLLAAEGPEQGRALLADLCRFLGRFLGREEPVEPQIQLAEAGMDSLLAIELRRAIKERYRIELLPGEMAAYASAGELAPMLCAILVASEDAPDEPAIEAAVADSLQRSGALDGGDVADVDLLALGEMERAAVFSDLGRAFGIALHPADLAGVSAVRELGPILLRRLAGLPGRAGLAGALSPSPAFYERYESAVAGLLGGVAGLERRTLGTDAGELEVFVCGDGPPLLLLPPLNGSALIWFHQIHQLSREHRVVAPNYPGYGRSTIGGDLSLQGLCRSMGMVVDALGLERFSVAGWSLGGAIAQLLVRERRDRVDALILVNTSAHLGLEGTAEEFHTVLGFLNEEYDAYPGADPALTPLGAEDVVVGVRGSDRIDLSYLYFSHVAKGDFRDALRGAAVPTLVFSGEDDRITPVKDGQHMADISGGSHQVVAGHGHLVPLFQPAVFNRGVRALLASAQDGGPAPLTTE